MDEGGHSGIAVDSVFAEMIDDSPVEVNEEGGDQLAKGDALLNT
jgi:hypothetical protein